MHTKRFLATNRFRPLPLPNQEPPPGAVSPPPPPPSPAVPPPPAPAPAAQGGEWYASYKPDVVEHIKKAGYPNAEAAIASDMHLQKLHGVPADQIVRRPVQGYDIDPKPYVAALEALGAPKEGKAFIEAGLFQPVEGLGQLPETTQTAAATKFAELRLQPWQAKGVMDLFNGLSKESAAASSVEQQAVQSDRNARLDAYRAERGGAFDGDVTAMRGLIAKFDRPLSGSAEQLKAAGHVRTQNGVIMVDDKGNPVPKGELEAWLDETQAGNDPRFLRAFASIAARFEPSSLTTDGGRQPAGPLGAMTQAQAAEELRKLEADQGFQKQLRDRSDAGHKAAVEKRLELIRLSAG